MRDAHLRRPEARLDVTALLHFADHAAIAEHYLTSPEPLQQALR